MSKRCRMESMVHASLWFDPVFRKDEERGTSGFVASSQLNYSLVAYTIFTVWGGKKAIIFFNERSPIEKINWRGIQVKILALISKI